jgi:hypothetical protein
MQKCTLSLFMSEEEKTVTVRICGCQKGSENGFQFSNGVDIDWFGDDFVLNYKTEKMHYLAIADPDGSWKYAGIDPTAFAKRLLIEIKNKIQHHEKNGNESEYWAYNNMVSDSYNQVFKEHEAGIGIYYGACSLIFIILNLKTLEVEYRNYGNTYLIIQRNSATCQLPKDSVLKTIIHQNGSVSKNKAIGIEFENVKVGCDGIHGRFQVMKSGDRVLLASNGLWNQIESEDVKKIISEHEDIDEECFALWQKSKMGPHRPDDITMILLECK